MSGVRPLLWLALVLTPVTALAQQNPAPRARSFEAVGRGHRPWPGGLRVGHGQPGRESVRGA